MKAKLGTAAFCSQDYIDTKLEKGNSQQARMYQAHKHTSGGYVWGEVKVVLTLRMLDGGSYLDISHIFCVKDKQVYPIFHRVVLKRNGYAMTAYPDTNCRAYYKMKMKGMKFHNILLLGNQVVS